MISRREGADGVMDESVSAERGGVPWLEGSLLRHLAVPSVLDIKAPGDPDGRPVTPGAAVAVATPDGRLTAGSAPLEGVYDAVFSRGALVSARQPRVALAAWFALVRPNGHLVLLLPGNASLPEDEADSTRNGEAPDDPAEALASLVETALPTGGFRVVHLDTVRARRDLGDAGPEGEIRLVLRRLPAENVRAETRGTPLTRTVVGAEVTIPFALVEPEPLRAPGLREADLRAAGLREAGPGRTDPSEANAGTEATGTLLVRDFAPRPAEVSRILVLKLDHHGDFIIGLPALRELRQAFPRAHLRLICGTWNVASAEASGLADEVRAFNFFPERAIDWKGPTPATDWDAFAAATEGRFDLAIDLRVDEDTRDLLGRVDAEIRCGIGSQERFPMLDVALPDATRALSLQPRPSRDRNADGSRILAPGDFDSVMETKTALFHETSFSPGDHLVLRSNDIPLPLGRYSAEFDLSVPRFIPGMGSVGVHVEVIANGERKVASNGFGRRALRGLNAARATLSFQSEGEKSFYDFRVHTSGKPLSGRLRFGGLRLTRLDTRAPRFRPSELHVGEKLLLLVSLIRQRALPLAQVPTPDGAPVADPPPREGPARFVVAPFSNSGVRDWPAGNYAELLNLLAKRLDCRIDVVGAPAQSTQAKELMERLEGHAREKVTNLVGGTRWSDIPALLTAADLVICNNSGIAHQSAALGARTLAIYSASHQPLEWGPRGARSRAIMMAMPCSPCGWERLEDCTNEHRCMTLITPRAVLAQVEHMLAGEAG